MREKRTWRTSYIYARINRESKSRPWGAWLIAIAILLMAGGCATPSPSGAYPGGFDTSSFDTGIDTRVSTALRTEIQSWIGTPHRMGGMSRRGIDCSGLVVVVYDALFDLQLPRTTADLIHVGQGVKKKNLTGGDLIFFTPEHKKRHVGIYLGRGEFAHASSSKGVMISRLDNTYWERYYVTGRRVL